MAKKNTTTKDLRQFGITLGVILGIFGGIHFLKGHTNAYSWFLGIALIFIFSGVILPKVLYPLFVVFTKAAHALGWFNTRVILILVYYIILTPIGLLMRLFGKNILDKKRHFHGQGYWVERAVPVVNRSDLEKQF